MKRLTLLTVTAFLLAAALMLFTHDFSPSPPSGGSETEAAQQGDGNSGTAHPTQETQTQSPDQTAQQPSASNTGTQSAQSGSSTPLTPEEEQQYKDKILKIIEGLKE